MLRRSISQPSVHGAGAALEAAEFPPPVHNGESRPTLRHAAIGLLRTWGLTNMQRAVNHLGRHPDQAAHLLLG